MKNYLKSFSDFFQVNEMASTLSKLGVPKKLISVIHNLPDEIEMIRPFTFNQGSARRAELPPISQNRPSHAVEVLDKFKMKKTKLLGNNYVPKGGSNREKKPGFLADLENIPWGDMRVLLAVEKPGGKYAGEAPRFDYIYHKASAWGKKAQGGGKKYRILTMDKDGKILRDWQAYQGDLTYPRDPNDRDAPRRRRNDFKDFPTDANGEIEVYILDPETVDYERAWQDLGYRGERKSHDVPIGKARKTKRQRTISKYHKADSFLEDFSEKFEKIISSIFGKRKDKAREKYGELLAAGTDATSDEMRDLHNTMLTNQDVNANLVNYYIKFLKYLMVHGKYENSDLVEILDADGNDIPGISASQIKNLVSITDVIDKHSKMSALRKLAEFIITGEVDDVHKEMEQAVDGFEEHGEKETETDDFESMLDYEGIDLENPFDEED
jgi:hypothetical protein